MDYQKQARDFLEKTGTSFKAEFVKHGVHFDGDTDTRDIYNITLTRGNRSYTFTFGQSINASGRFWKYGNPKRGVSMGYLPKGLKTWKPPISLGEYRAWDLNKNFAEPTPYEVLACLQKYPVDTFADFCGNFGYDEDSIRAEKTYNAVKKEYAELCRLFSDVEIEAMAEIQ